jgi:hypothetical protein
LEGKKRRREEMEEVGGEVVEQK